ncbi:MAG: hypothetical protein COY66_00550 [Candidatus Kerfeldbacteria bacterium CG_4_10_14_0_8_um_filter_42_10]|uniref:EF-hand domain-containing protein n=1 Tax=Candidatus Kerfeldbacteria bacterium CG_4_10_14_0_8_um_filter_42_10 TaxID=2014248 RepID=A0A2M7RKJ2_9BACT|nr:MAG: hypothetical protein COY66_00550 [Candidatus Kerfeldbacteria bacterium CG_4_10_14_0_8_um_filter_42_10]
MPESIPPSNIPNNRPPEDIFKDTDQSPFASPPQPNMTPPPNQPAGMASVPPAPSVRPAEIPSPKGGRTMLIAGIVVIALVILGGGAFAYYLVTKDSDKTNTNTNSNAVVNTNQSANTNQAVNTNIANTNVSQNTNQPADSDGDGLADTEEEALGTNSKKSDTDGDELFDLEEVRVYKTNPTKADTDGDGYLDGAEVKEGYDPNGPGKLRDIGEEINKLE